MQDMSTRLVFIASVVFLPILLPLLALLALYKQMVVLLAKLFGDVVRPIPSSNSLFLSDHIYTKPHSNIVVPVGLNCTVSKEGVVAQFSKLLTFKNKDGSWCYAELGYCIEQFLGYGFWKECKNFQICDVVCETDESDDTKTLAEFSEYLARKPFIKGKPLWNVYITKKSYLPGGKLHDFLFINFHHILMDGLSVIKIFENVFGNETFPANCSVKVKKQKTGLLKLVTEPIRLATQGFTEYIDEMLVKQDRHCLYYKNNMKQKFSGKWIRALGEPVEVEALKKVAKLHDCSIVHILLTACTKAFNQYMKNYHGSAGMENGFNFLAAAPLPGHPDFKLVNRWCIAKFHSKPGVTSLKDGLEYFKDELERCKTSSSLPIVSGFLFQYLLGILPVALTHMAGNANMSTTILFSNTVGPRGKGFYCQDAAVDDLCFFMPTVHEALALSLGAISFQGKLRVSLSGDTACIPTREHLNALMDMVNAELMEICDAKTA